MISRVRGTLLTRDTGRIEIETQGGVVYEVHVPLPVLQRLPAPGTALELRTHQVVTDTSIALYGFIEALERTMFQRLLGTTGIGPKVALTMMSTYSVERLARALVERDIPALQQISGIGKKTAEKIALELADKVTEFAVVMPDTSGQTGGAREAVQALVALGYAFADADRAVRAVVESGAPDSTEELIRQALVSD